MDTRGRAQQDSATSQIARWWSKPRSRADALKLGAAGAGLGLLGALPTDAQAAGEAVSGTLSLTWYHSGDPLTKRLYKQYMARRPTVKIAEIAEPGGDYAAIRAWLATRILAGRMPDIFEPGTVSLVLDGVAKKQWVDLDPYLSLPNPYVKGNKQWRDLIVPGLLDQGKYLDNRMYIFAAEAAEWVIFYSKDIFKKLRLQPPATWADLMTISQKLAGAGYGAFSLGGAVGLSSFGIVVESMLWAGAFKHRVDEPYFMSPLDFCRAVKAGKLVKTDKRTRQAWQLIKAFSAYWTKGTLTAADFRSFTSGKTAMWYTGSWAANSLQDAIKKKFELGLFPIPPVTRKSSPLAIGDTYSGIGVLASGHPYAIPVTSKRKGHLALAIDFLQFYSQPDVVTPLALAGSMIPAVVGTKHLPPLMKQVREEVIPKQSLLGPVYFDLNTELTTKEGQLLQGYLAGAVSLDTALSQMEQLHQQVATSALASVGRS